MVKWNRLSKNVSISNVYALKITLGDTGFFFWFTEFFHLYLMPEDGVKKKILHNAKVLNSACLISPMAWSFDVCKVLKLNTYDQVNIERNMYKVVSKLYFKNNHENNVTSVNKIYIKFMWKKIKFLFQENGLGGSVNFKNKLMLPYLPWNR